MSYQKGRLNLSTYPQSKETFYIASRTPSIVVADILRCIEHVESYTAKRSFDDSHPISWLSKRCFYNIQVIGETVNQLADDIKTFNPQIPRTLIEGMRNRLIHEYFGIDLALVWSTIRNDLPGFED
jgi:uncharacterized protein with HEPN domain